jgi:uncharacterized membrane protein
MTETTTAPASTSSQSRHHPALAEAAELRASDTQLRVADAITKFAGSMMFVYVHIIIFVVWMTAFESSPWPTLTLVVSLEAIFLSTFVMIGQNRQASFQQAKADHDFNTNEQELHVNTELTKSIHTLTQQLHQQIFQGHPVAPANPGTETNPPTA